MQKVRRRLLPIMAALLLATSLPSVSGPSRYNRTHHEVSPQVLPSDEVLELARKLAYPDFPKAQDILAIARVESRFMANARNRRSHGIMQVNDGPWDLKANMEAGVRLLRQYFEELGSVKAAITAYNCGPVNYLKGKCRGVYFNKVEEKRREYEEWMGIEDNRIRDSAGSLGGNRAVQDLEPTDGGLLLPEDLPAGIGTDEEGYGDSDPQHYPPEGVPETLGPVTGE